MSNRINALKKYATSQNIDLVSYLAIIFLSLFATLGSLYYSDVKGLVPCLLCWYQRIAMYPIVIITVVGLFTQMPKLRLFIASLSVPGMLIAAYHVYLQAFQLDNQFGTCSVATPCQEVQYALGGVFTIAVQSLIAFGLINVILLVSFMLLRRKNA